MTNVKSSQKLPDWWQREKQRRLLRVLLFLVLLGMLVGYFYYSSGTGVGVNGINFDTTNYIAFVRDDNQGHSTLYAIRDDGTGEHPLTHSDDTAGKSHPAWTMDGKSLLYASNRNDSKVTQIYLLGNGDPQQLTYGTGNKSFPIASPDGKHVAFLTQGAIKSVYLNGSDVYQLMPQPRSGNEGSEESGVPTMDPTGAFLSISLCSNPECQEDLFKGLGIAGVQDTTDEVNGASMEGMEDQAVAVIPPGGGPTKWLETGHEVSMDWEAHGTRLAASFTELHALKPNAKPVETDGGKEWQRLFEKDKNATLISGIRIWSFDNGKVTSRNLFIGLGYSIEPKNIAWSPDGAHMAFEGWRLKGEGQRELSGIAVLQVDAGNGVQGPMIDEAHADKMPYIVPSTPEGKPQNPRWSPDGRHLLYELVKPNGKRDLYVINADGTNPINLTKGNGDNYDGAWAPGK